MTRFFAASMILALGVACTDANEGGGDKVPDAGGNTPAADSGPAAPQDAGDDAGPGLRDGGNNAPDGSVRQPFDAGAAEIGDDCVAALRCAFTCQPGDPGCAEACLAAAKPSHRVLAREVLECVRASGCDPEDVQCTENACGASINSCMEMSGPGTGLNDYECMEGIFCALECIDDGCVHQCVAGVRDDQENTARAVMECAQRANCQTYECIEERCPEALLACNGNGQSSGNMCVEAMQCLMNDCDLEGDDREACCVRCGEGIDGEENPESRDHYVAICTCIQANDCTGRGCMEESCMGEFEACME
jgi:hypothetical protein